LVSTDYSQISNSDAFILPGVGAFRDAMMNLHEKNYIEPLLNEIINKQKPILGICLGMQLLFSYSEEGGINKGLDLIEGGVIILNPGSNYRVPHVGWNDLIIKKPLMFEGLRNDLNVYFVHSYYAQTSSDYITATFEYGSEYTASVMKNNIWGTQFHPEKSQKNGFQILKNYITFCERGF